MYDWTSAPLIDVVRRLRSPAAVDAAEVGVAKFVRIDERGGPRADDADVAGVAELALEAQDVERGRRRREPEMGGAGGIPIWTMVTRLGAVIALSAPMVQAGPRRPTTLPAP